MCEADEGEGERGGGRAHGLSAAPARMAPPAACRLHLHPHCTAAHCTHSLAPPRLRILSLSLSHASRLVSTVSVVSARALCSRVGLQLSAGPAPPRGPDLFTSRAATCLRAATGRGVRAAVESPSLANPSRFARDSCDCDSYCYCRGTF